MKKFINAFLSFFKYILLVSSFGLTLFITLRMYTRLNKGIGDAIFTFLPYLLLLVAFALNILLKRKYVSGNTFFNITCNVVFITNIVACLRSIFDKNMLFNGIQKMGVNFTFFNDYLAFNKITLYGLLIANIFFMFIPNEKEEQKIKSQGKADLEIPLIKKETVIETNIEMDDELI